LGFHEGCASDLGFNPYLDYTQLFKTLHIILLLPPLTDRILGIKAYSSVKEIPDVVDLAVIPTPRPPVLDIVKECTEKGIRAMVIVAQGFAHGDEEGKALQGERTSTGSVIFP